MAMTMKVYKVDRYGAVQQVLREEAEVAPLKTAEPSSAYPACQCDKCAAPS